MLSSDDGDGALSSDPLSWFRNAFQQAGASESFDASRAALATCSGQGRVSVRFVLVKGFDERGFVFYTNLESRKARDLADNPQAALAFHWASTGDQVRIEGVVSRISEAESDAYFATRPRGSQLGAWASQQSAPIDTRAALAALWEEQAARFERAERVPRPAHWGGFRLVASSIEFWHDRTDRMHDRFCFTREGSAWSRVRLQP